MSTNNSTEKKEKQGQMKNDQSKKNEILPSDNKKEPSPDIELPDLSGLPEEIRPQVKRMFMGLMQTSGTAPRHHPLFDKFTEDHIHKYLDYVQRDDDNEYKIRSSNRWFIFFYTILSVGAFLFLITYLLPKDKALKIKLY